MKNIVNIHFARLVVIWISCIVLATSCVPYNSIINYSESGPLPGEPQPIQNANPLIIQPNDILQITVTSMEVESEALFNKNQQNGYQVSEEGTIDFPYVGKINIAGNTLNGAQGVIREELTQFFVQPPSVQVRLVNFKINIHGEINNPGTYEVANGRINILEAITRAGDFTSYSRRDSILIVREKANMRSFGYVDFNTIDIMNSPYYYLQQNDVVYVQPARRKTGTIRDRESKFLPYISVGTSLLLFITAILNLR